MRMNLRAIGRRIGLVAALSAGSTHGQLVESDFTNGIDGWTVADNAGEPLFHIGDHIVAFDSDPADLSFVAPAHFLGDLSLAYRGELSFELIPSVRPFQPTIPAVEITGGTMGPMGTPIILRNEFTPPATYLEFSQHSVRFNERAGWEVLGEGRNATAEELRDVLGDLLDLRIVADSATKPDESIGLRAVRIDRPSVRVLIAAGQSNMSGCADFNLLPTWDFTPRHDLIFWNQLNDAYEPLTYGSSDANCGHMPPDRPNHYGPEIGFADAFLDLLADELLVLIKFTAGGTSMHVDWVPPGLNPARPNGGPLYGLFYSELDLAFAQLDAAGYQYTVEGTIWMQGESDADRNGRSAPHQTQLTQFIADLRSYVGNPQMPYIIGRIADNDLGFDEVVRDAQVAVADADPFSCWVNTDDLTKLDFFHYDEPSTIELGFRFAEALRRISAPPGDANFDGIVDIEDVYHWNQNPSDENCDGMIDQADLGVIMQTVRDE